MQIKSKVSSHGTDRKIVELPKSIRDNFEVGDAVGVEKIHQTYANCPKCPRKFYADADTLKEANQKVSLLVSKHLASKHPEVKHV